MTHSPDRNPKGQDAQQLGAKHESRNSSNPDQTTPSISELAELVKLLRSPDRWDAHYYAQGFGSTRNSQVPLKAADALESLTRPVSPEPLSDAAVERVWNALKDRVCADAENAKRCIMVGRDDVAAALSASIPPTAQGEVVQADAWEVGPQFPSVECGREPSLSRIVFGYYAEHFDADKAEELTQQYHRLAFSHPSGEVAKVVPSFQQPYADAGHDVESLFKPNGSYRCSRCGAAQIDLSEDLAYGEMTKCATPEAVSQIQGER